jgi:hypothetical protein
LFDMPGQDGWDHYVLNPSSIFAKQRYVAYIQSECCFWF